MNPTEHQDQAAIMQGVALAVILSMICKPTAHFMAVACVLSALVALIISRIKKM